MAECEVFFGSTTSTSVAADVAGAYEYINSASQRRLIFMEPGIKRDIVVAVGPDVQHFVRMKFHKKC